MKFQPFAFWVAALTAGIVIQQRLWLKDDVLWIGAGISFLLLLISLSFGRLRQLFPFLAIVFLMLTGSLRFQQKNFNVLNLPELTEARQLLQFEVETNLRSSAKYNKYIVQPINGANEELLDQKFLIYIRRSQPYLHVKDRFWTYGKVQLIDGPKNPHQFDYKRYMGMKGVGLQIFADTVTLIDHPANFSFSHHISEFKSEIKKKLENNGFSPESRIFISALALGDRNDLTPEFQEKLSSAGVMHLFAISGLHVGIVFAFIMILLYPVLYMKKGRYLRIVLALMVIWFYAWFVGFTPSVTRAAFMITVYYTCLLYTSDAADE